jgi:hypothetical protein
VKIRWFFSTVRVQVPLSPKKLKKSTKFYFFCVVYINR